MAVDIPGPNGWWLIGNVLEVDTEHFHTTLWKWKEEFGPIYQFKVFSKNIIVISDVDLMRRAFAIEDLCHRPDNFANVLMYNGSGVVSANFTEQQRVWKKIVWDVLYETQDDPELLKLFDLELMEFVDSLDTHEDVDIHTWLEESISKQMASDFIGVKTSAVHGSAVVKFLGAINELYRRGRELILTKLPWLRYIPGIYRWVVNDLLEKQTLLVDLFMEEARNTHIKDGEHSILHRLIVKQKEANVKHGGNFITDENLYSCILELLMASVLPISQNIEFALLSAVMYPDIQEKINKEIHQGGSIIDLQIEDLPYFRAFVLECFRYFSMVMITVPRLVSKDTEVDGFLFKEGSLLLGSLFYIHHDEKLWKDPFVFRPERFLDNDGTLLPENSEVMKSLNIFGFQFRDCKAKKQAIDKVQKYILYILYIYEVKAPLGAELPSFDPREYNTVTVMNMPTFKCRFERRD